MEKTFVVGITGGIASGKTAVTSVLKKKGAYIIDADEISRKAVEPGTEVNAKLSAVFPEAFDSGILNRPVLRKIVFADDKKRKLLDSIIHPAIIDEMRREIANCPQKVAFLIVPLLFETGSDELCDYIVTIVSDESKRIERLVERDNTTEEDALSVIRSQISENERVTKSDEVIVNNESLDKLAVKAAEFYKKILEKVK